MIGNKNLVVILREPYRNVTPCADKVWIGAGAESGHWRDIFADSLAYLPLPLPGSHVTKPPPIPLLKQQIHCPFVD